MPKNTSQSEYITLFIWSLMLRVPQGHFLLYHRRLSRLFVAVSGM
jgi:hypothetical protein